MSSTEDCTDEQLKEFVRTSQESSACFVKLSDQWLNFVEVQDGEINREKSQNKILAAQIEDMRKRHTEESLFYRESNARLLQQVEELNNSNRLLINQINAAKTDIIGTKKIADTDTSSMRRALYEKETAYVECLSRNNSLVQQLTQKSEDLVNFKADTARKIYQKDRDMSSLMDENKSIKSQFDKERKELNARNENALKYKGEQFDSQINELNRTINDLRDQLEKAQKAPRTVIVKDVPLATSEMRFNLNRCTKQKDAAIYIAREFADLCVLIYLSKSKEEEDEKVPDIISKIVAIFDKIDQ